MALLSKKGTFSLLTTDSGAKAIAGVGFQPKALIVWAGRATSDNTWTAHATLNMGVADEDLATFNVKIMDEDVVATQDVARSLHSTSLLRGYSNGAGTIDYTATLTSLDAGGFTLDVTDAPSVDIIVHYLALGGSDITDVKAGTFAPGVVATADVPITSFGQPDLLFFLSTGVPAEASAGGGGLSFGVAKSDTERAAVTYAGGDGSATMSSGSYLVALALAGVRPDAAIATDFEMELSARAAWPTDGFEVSFPTQMPDNSPVRTIVYLALKGTFQSKIGLASAPTSAGNQDLDATFPPVASMFFGDSLPSHSTFDTSHANGHSMAVGAFDGTSQGMIAIQQDDGAADSVAKNISDASRALRHNSPGSPPATLGEAVASYPSGNTVRLAWTNPSATARQFAWTALGSASTAIEKTLTPATSTNTAQALTFTQGIVYESSWGDLGIEYGMLPFAGETTVPEEPGAERRRYSLPPMSP
jgi:hypothetical protein